MSEHSVAVVIRAHNLGRHLDEAVTSVRGQSQAADQIVVIDDGSRDDTPAILSRLENGMPPLIVIRHEQAVGPALAFNRGVEASSCDLILPLDADDRLSPRFIECCTRVLDETGADIAFPGAELFGAVVESWPAHDVDLDALRIENEMHVSCLFRRWVFDAVGGFDPGFDGLGLEDWDFWVSAVESGAVITPVDGCWLEYRRTGDKSRNKMSRLTALRAHCRVYQRHPSVHLSHVARWGLRSIRRNMPVPSVQDPPQADA